MDPDLLLMQKVQRLAGPYLTAFSPSSSVPEAFWAALTANESGGHIGATRFEAGVYAHLSELRETGFTTVRGVKAMEYNGLTRQDLVPFTDLEIRGDLATSHGFTQIMGYHRLRWRSPLDYVTDPDTHYYAAAKLMAGICAQFALDPTSEFEAMARAWNSGRPDGQTYDPNYVANLLHRMILWASLPESVTVKG